MSNELDIEAWQRWAWATIQGMYEKDAEIARLSAELAKCRVDAERWRYTLAHGFPVRGQNGDWYGVDARDFKGFPTPTAAIDAARSKP